MCTFTAPQPLIKLPPKPRNTPIQKPPTPAPKPSDIPKRQKLFPQRKMALTPAQVNGEIQAALEREECFPRHVPIKDAIGKTMFPQIFALSRPAVKTIEQWGRHGCPVNCGKDWSVEHILAALKRGPHKSAKSPEAIEALMAETAEKLQSGYARLVKWRDINTTFQKAKN